LVLLAPHRRLCLKFLCAVSTTSHPLAAMGFILSDVLIICQRLKGGTLRAWMIVGLRDLLIADEAFDNGESRFGIIAQPLTEFFLPIRISPLARAKIPSLVQHWSQDDDPSDRKHRQRERLPNRESKRNSTAEATEEECARLEFETHEALEAVQQTLHSCFEALEKADADARRPERRLRTTHLEDGVRDLVVELADERASTEADIRKQAERKSSTMHRLLSARSLGSGKEPRAEAKPSAKEVVRQPSTPLSEVSSETAKRRLLTSKVNAGTGSSETSLASTPMSPRASFSDLLEHSSPRRSLTSRRSMSGSSQVSPAASTAAMHATSLAADRQQQAVADPLNHFFGDKMFERFD